MFSQIFRRVSYELRPEVRAWRRIYRQLRTLPRYQTTVVSLWNYNLKILDGPSFLSAFKSIFINEAYRIASNKRPVRIIDCGANIGLAILYFKIAFPDCHIRAFEADPMVAAILRSNVERNRLTNVSVIEAAAWTENCTVPFLQEGADSGRIDNSVPGLGVVKAVRLRDYLTEEISLLKIDIEGAETKVLSDCIGALANVESLITESHSFSERPQSLEDLLRIYSASGFRYYIFEEQPSFCPAQSVPLYKGMDQHLLVHGIRPTLINYQMVH